MNHQDILDQLNVIEKSLNPGSWYDLGFHYWPVLRSKIFEALLPQLFSANVGIKNLSVSQKIKFRLNQEFRARRANVSKKSPMRFDQWPIVFKSNPVNKLELEGVFYDHVGEYFAQQVKNNSYPMIFLESEIPVHLPKSQATWYLAPQLLQVSLGMKLGFGPKLSEETLRRVDQLVDEARKLNINLDSRYLCHNLLKTYHYAKSYERLLREKNTKIAFFVNYDIPFCLGAFFADIKTIEVQHGVGGAAHWYYGNWASVPKKGFEALPDFYWCWGEGEAQAIKSWSGFQGDKHRPMVGGNVRTLSTLTLQEKVKNRYSEDLSSLPRKIILVTLQWRLDLEKDLAHLWRYLYSLNNQDRELWGIRLHPCMSIQERQKASEIVDRMHLSSKLQYIVNQVPIGVLFEYVVVNVTYSSATVLDAENFGIPSILLWNGSRQLFEGTTAWKNCTVATTEREIHDALARVDGKQHHIDVTLAHAKKAFQQLTMLT